MICIVSLLLLFHTTAAYEVQFDTFSISSAAASVNAVLSVDIDDDGDVDIITASAADGGRVTLLRNDGNQQFVEHALGSKGGEQSLHAIDLDGDGDIDVLCGSTNAITWYRNDGHYSFSSHSVTSSASNVKGLYAADVDGDGDIDIVAAAYGNNYIYWYENNGHETFTMHSIAGLSYVTDVYAGDMDADGDVDVVAVNYRYDSGYRYGYSNLYYTDVYWYENVGNQVFTSHQIHEFSATTSPFISKLAVADVDTDGDYDIVTYSYSGLYWFENTGQSAFTYHMIETSLTSISDVYAVDLDSDGDMDILVSSSAANNALAWYENDGNQVFDLNTVDKDITARSCVTAADVNQDGVIDIVSASSSSSSSNNIQWHQNPQCAPGTRGYARPYCQKCLPGSYSTEVSSFNCSHCPTGTYSSIWGATSPNACIEVPAGTYSNQDGRTGPALCNAGSYSAKPGQSSCTLCDEGTYTSKLGSTQCTPCVAGSYSPRKGSAQCLACSTNYYSSADGAVDCSQCPRGTYTDAEKSLECLSCPAGTYADKKNPNKCQQCPAGFYADKKGSLSCHSCSEGTYSHHGASHCSECPWITWSRWTGSNSCDQMKLKTPLALVITFTCFLAFVIVAMAYYAGTSAEAFLLVLIASAAWITDLLYIMLATFTNGTVLYLLMIFFFIPPIWQIACIEYKQYCTAGSLPRVLFIHIGENIHNRIYGMVISRANDQYDTLPKVGLIMLRRIIYGLLYCFYWLPWAIVHVVYGLILLAVSHVLVESKLLMHVKIQHQWRMLLTGVHSNHSEKNQCDVCIYNELILMNIIIGLMPQMILQIVNGALMKEINSPIWYISITTSCIAIILFLWRWIYWNCIRHYDLMNMPLLFGDLTFCTSIQIPFAVVSNPMMSDQQSYNRVDPIDVDKSRMMHFLTTQAGLGTTSATRFVNALEAAQIDSIAALNILLTDEGDNSENYLKSNFHLNTPNAKLILKALEKISNDEMTTIHEVNEIEMIQQDDSSSSVSATGYPILPTVTPITEKV